MSKPRTTHNLGAEITTVRQLLDRAANNGFVGVGEVALSEAYQVLDRLMAIDAKTPLQFTVESADITDTEHGEVTGSQVRLVGEWWVSVPDAMPLSPGVRHQREKREAADAEFKRGYRQGVIEAAMKGNDASLTVPE